MKAMFVSTHDTLMLHTPPIPLQSLQGTQVITTYVSDCVEFKGGKYVTEDEKIIEFLRGYPSNGTSFYEVKESAKPAADAPPAEPDVDKVTSKNAAIAYLLQVKGAAVEDFSGKKSAEVAAIAAEKFGITFPKWNVAK